MNTLSLVIMCHPKRMHFVNSYMIPRINKQACDFHISCDVNSRGLWWNGQHSWQIRDPSCTHTLVVQDDQFLCKDFVETVNQLIQIIPDQPMSLYCTLSLVNEAKKNGDPWIIIKAGCWGNAIILPEPLIDEWLSWTHAHILPTLKTYDNRMAMWAVKTNRPFWVTVPSLVDHQGAAFSLIGNSNRARRATWFIGDDISGLNFNWDIPKAPLKGSAGIDPKHWEAYKP